jgi:hypothetical protein
MIIKESGIIGGDDCANRYFPGVKKRRKKFLITILNIKKALGITLKI